MDLPDRLQLAWRHLDDADRDEVVVLAEDLAADRQSWWAERHGGGTLDTEPNAR